MWIGVLFAIGKVASHFEFVDSAQSLVVREIVQRHDLFSVSFRMMVFDFCVSSVRSAMAMAIENWCFAGANILRAADAVRWTQTHIVRVYDGGAVQSSASNHIITHMYNRN